MSRTKNLTIEPLQPSQAPGPAPAPPAATPVSPDWRTRILALEQRLARTAAYSGNPNAEMLLGLVRLLVAIRAFRFLDRAEKLGAEVLSPEPDVMLLRARMAALQVDLGRVAEEAAG